MGTPAPDAVKRLVDRFDQDHKVFLSGDNQAGTRDWGLGTRDPNPNPKPLAPDPSCTALGWDMDNKQGLSEFSVIANTVRSSMSIVPGTEDRKPGTKNREPRTNQVIRLTAGHQAKVEKKSEVRKAGGIRACA